jgi:hypothetical protein
MKNATLPPLRVDGALRAAVESVFVLEAVCLNLEPREARREFIARGLRARENARATNDYVSAGEMLSQLDGVLAQARDKAGVPLIYQIRLALAAAEDLQRLFEFLAQQDIDAAERARLAIDKAFAFLQGIFLSLAARHRPNIPSCAKCSSNLAAQGTLPCTKSSRVTR